MEPAAIGPPVTELPTMKQPTMAQEAGHEVLTGIQALWQQVLELPQGKVQPDSHFLLLGGDSLQLARLLAMVKTGFGVSLPMHELSRFATPARMAACCSAALQIVDAVAEAAGGALTDSGVAPATQVQEGIWLVEQLAAPHSLYLASVLLQLQGPLDLVALRKATAALFQQNPVLRARLCLDPGTRRLHLHLPASVPTAAEAALLPQQCEAWQLAAQIQQAVQQPLALDRGPLCRLQLFQLAAQQHVLLISCHHVISDGWSGGNLLAQLAATYCKALQQQELSVPEPDLHFLHYCRRLVTERETDDGERLQWWRKQLAGMEQTQQWLWQGQCAEPWPHAIARISLAVPQSLVVQLRARAQVLRHSLFTLFLHAVKAGLFSCSGEPRQVLLVPVAQRQPEEEGSIGCFIAPMLLAGEWQPELEVDSALQIDAAAVAAARREQLPLATLASALRPRPLPDGNPWSSILFAFQSYPQAPLQWPGLVHQLQAVPGCSSQYALKLEVVPGTAAQEPWQLHIEYACALLESTRVAALGAAILARLQCLATC
jgi:acyl carrier protein